MDTAGIACLVNILIDFRGPFTTNNNLNPDMNCYLYLL